MLLAAFDLQHWSLKMEQRKQKETPEPEKKTNKYK